MPDWTKILQLLPLILTKPGTPQGAALMQGYTQTMERMQQEQRQQDQLSGQQEVQQAQIRNLDEDNRRAEAQLALQRLTASRNEGGNVLESLAKAPETYLSPGTDPLQAQNQLVIDQFQAQQAYGVPEGTPQTPLPNMTQLVSEGKKRRAAQWYAKFEKEYGDQATDAATSFRVPPGDQEFSGMTPADIRALSTTMPIAPPGKKTSATPGSFEEYVDAPPERQATIRARRKEYQQSDDRPQTGATVVIQTVDAQGNPVTRIVPKTPGAEFAAPPTGQQRQQVAENEAVASGLARLRELAPDVATLAQWVGPVQGRKNSIALVTPGMAVDPQMAEFFAEVAAIKNRMIRAITGAQMSEPEAKRIMAQLPDIALKPGVFLARLQATERNLAALNARIAAQSGRGPAIAPTPSHEGTADSALSILEQRRRTR